MPFIQKEELNLVNKEAAASFKRKLQAIGEPDELNEFQSFFWLAACSSQLAAHFKYEAS
jgi:hypothetical protein